MSMQVAKIEVDRAKAASLYQTYKAHRGAHTKEDAEIERIYYQISRGRKVIRAMESVRAAGLDGEGRPKLALIRADAKRCRCTVWSSHLEFYNEAHRWKSNRSHIKVDWPGLPSSRNDLLAIVPLIPVHLRPEASKLHLYHILWEADWKTVPVDPMLLRRIGGDTWIVVAAWDLTAVEQAVLAGRL